MAPDFLSNRFNLNMNFHRRKKNNYLLFNFLVAKLYRIFLSY